MVRVEAAVLDGDDGFQKRVGDLVDRHVIFALAHALSDGVAQEDEPPRLLRLWQGIEERWPEDRRAARDEEGEAEDRDEEEGKAQEPLEFLHDGRSVLLFVV